MINGRLTARFLSSIALLSATAPTLAAGSAEQATRAAIARVERIEPSINAVIALDPTAIDQARRVDASGLRGPLAGVPILI